VIAPSEAQAAAGGLAVGSVVMLAWGLVLLLHERASRRRSRAAARLSRTLFAAAGVRRRYRLP
jgi:hypothetical protein